MRTRRLTASTLGRSGQKRSAALIWTIAFIAIVLIGAAWLIPPIDSAGNQSGYSDAVPEAARQPASVANAEKDGKVEAAVDKGDINAAEPAPEVSVERVSDETRSWLQRIGFTTEYNIHFTNQAFLETQAASGDMLAAQMLGYQMLGSARGDRYLMDAARWGSVRALHYLSTSSRYKAEGRLQVQRQGAESKVDQRHASIKALEYLFVAELRGDNYAAPHSIDRLMKRLSYTESDIGQACNQALHTYRKLERERLAEGKPPFENAPAPNSDQRTRYNAVCPDG